MAGFDFSPQYLQRQGASSALINDASRSGLTGLTDRLNILAKDQETRDVRNAEIARKQGNENRRFGLLEAANTRANDKALVEANQRQALVGASSNYDPYATAQNPYLDQQVLSRTDLLTPNVATNPDGSLLLNEQGVPDIDQDTFNRQAQIQALYEQQQPSKEEATSSIIADAISRGASPADAQVLAKSLTTGLTSDATKLATAQEQAKTFNKRKELLFKEDNKAFVKGISARGGSTSGGTKKSSGVNSKTTWPSLFKKLVDSQGDFGNWDANALKAEAEKQENIPGMTPQIFMNAVNRSATAGVLPFIGDKKAFTDSNLKEALAQELVAASTQTGTYSSNNRTLSGQPTLGRAATAGDFLQSAQRQENQVTQNRLDEIFGTQQPEVKDKANSILSGDTESKELNKTNLLNDEDTDQLSEDEINSMLSSSNYSEQEKKDVRAAFNMDLKPLVEESDKLDKEIIELENSFNTTPTTDQKKQVKVLEDKKESTLTKYINDLFTPGYFANRIKKIEHTDGASAAVVETLLGSGPAVIADLATGGITSLTIKQGIKQGIKKKLLSKAATKRAQNTTRRNLTRNTKSRQELDDLLGSPTVIRESRNNVLQRSRNLSQGVKPKGTIDDFVDAAVNTAQKAKGAKPLTEKQLQRTIKEARTAFTRSTKVK